LTFFTAKSTENASLDKYAKNAQLNSFIYGTIERSQSLDINKACDSFTKSSTDKCSTIVAKIDSPKMELLPKLSLTYPQKQKAGKDIIYC